jgi:parallel beta-helix repeat protein
MSTGDDVYFQVNTETEFDAVLAVNWGGSESDRVVIGAYYGDRQFGLNGNDRPIIDGNWTVPSKGSYSGMIRISTTTGYVTVENLDIRKSGGSGVAVAPYSAATIPYVIVRDCFTSQTWRAGVLLNRASYSLVEDNTIYWPSYGHQPPTTTTNGAGIEIISGDDAVYEEYTQFNTVRGNTVSYGVEGIGVYKRARHTTIENNTIFDCWTYHLYVARSRDGELRDNVIYDTASKRGSASSGKGIVFGQEVVSASTGVVKAYAPVNNWLVYNNYIAGMHIGYSLEVDLYNPFGPVPLTNLRFYNNILVDNMYGYSTTHNNESWVGNTMNSNYFYNYSYNDGMRHIRPGYESSLGVSWEGNYYTCGGCTAQESLVSGNAATNAKYNQATLIKTTGWRDLEPGEVDESFFISVGETFLKKVMNVAVIAE